MVNHHPPFTYAVKDDPFYELLAKNRADLFWMAHCQHLKHGMDTYSDEFKDLLTCMLQFDPAHRPSMTEVMAHPWVQKPNLSRIQIKKAFA